MADLSLSNKLDPSQDQDTYEDLYRGEASNYYDEDCHYYGGGATLEEL